MAGLFLVFVLVMLAIWLRQRKLAIGMIAVGLVLILAMFWYHANDTLQINW